MSKKRRHEEHEEHQDESWLLPYSDLMTLLLALFIVLYSMSSVDAKKFEEMSTAFKMTFHNGNGVLESPAIVKTGDVPDNIKEKDKDKANDEDREALMKQEQEDLEKLKKQVDEYIKSQGLTTELETKLNQSQLTITISDNALFASGSAAVKPESKELAHAIATMLQNYTDYDIVVSGHTDNQPISNAEFQSNWDLSSSRAIRFMDILLQNTKLKPERFSAIGYGEYRPLDTNDTVEGRAKNRRVEVSIMRKYVDLSSTQTVSASQ